jgi:hypothetical protein
MKRCFIFYGLILLSLVTFNSPVLSQKRAAITGSGQYLNNSGEDQTIETALRTMFAGKGWSVSGDTVDVDLKIRYKATTSAGNSTSGLVFVYVNASVSLIEMPAGKEIARLIFPAIKGGGTNISSANQKAYQSASKKIADSVGQLLADNKSAYPDQVQKTSPAVALSSDVDKNIPATLVRNDKIYALIIGNEDYKSFQPGLNDEVNVDFAVHDASVFKMYLNKTIGVPEENIKLLLNARSIEMSRELKKLLAFIKTLEGSAEIIVYYAGHGLPDETTKQPYLVPVDVSGADLQFGIRLSDMYAQLTSFPSRRVTVFLDACFTGGARGQGLLAARGVKIKPAENILSGNLVIYSASSAEQSSLSYKEKSHGMFTYYLLKKIQETKGKVSYKTLSDYLTREVSLQSLKINNKEQNPMVTVAQDIQNQWESWMLNE